MTLLQIIKNAFLIAIIDLPYLTLVSGQFKPMIQSIQGSPLQFRLWAAVPVYFALGYLLSLANSWRQAALIGAATYAVYDFTNLATLAKYPIQFAIQDTLWGATLMAITFKVSQMIF
jgi:uncharacterized membrane protein